MVESKKFISLKEILGERCVDVSTILFAITMYGLWEYDFDEPKKLRASSIYLSDVRGILNALYLSFINSEEENKKAHDDFDMVSTIYGWPSQYLPNFDDVGKIKKSKLRTIAWLLEKHDPVPHAGLAEEIESRGVYGLDKEGNLRHYPPESIHAQDALTAISIRLNADQRSYDPDWEEWYAESDSNYSYGWPSNEIPNFRQTEDYGWMESFHRLQSRSAFFKKELYTIGRILLTRKARPSSIAKAIQRVGVCGYGEFGEPTTFAFTSESLDELKEHLKIYAEELLKGRQPDVSLLDANPYHRFGWPDDKLPDFESIENEPIPELVGQQSEVGESKTRSVHVDSEGPELSKAKKHGYDLTIGALLMFIRGKMNNKAHEDYKSQEELADLIDNEFKTRGAGTRSVKEKFADANKALKSKGIDPGEEK